MSQLEDSSRVESREGDLLLAIVDVEEQIHKLTNEPQKYSRSSNGEIDMQKMMQSADFRDFSLAMAKRKHSELVNELNDIHAPPSRARKIGRALRGILF